TPSPLTACTAGPSTSPRRVPCWPCWTWPSPPVSPPAAGSPPPPAPPTGYGSPSPPPRAPPSSTPCGADSIWTGCAWRSPHERGRRMSRVAEGVSPLELADYQKAVRLVLRHPLVTPGYPDKAALATV